MKVKFIIRDITGHSQVLVPPELADQKADELRDKGYLIIAGNNAINYGESIRGLKEVEAIPMPTSG